MGDVELSMLKHVLHLKRKHKEEEEILLLCEKRARYVAFFTPFLPAGRSAPR